MAVDGRREFSGGGRGGLPRRCHARSRSSNCFANLPLLENLDEYRQVGSIEFLHKLRDEKLFSKDSAEPPKSETADDEDMPSRRRRIVNMSLDEKEQLLRSEDRFTSLTPEEQRSVRRLHEDLQNDPDARTAAGDHARLL